MENQNYEQPSQSSEDLFTGMPPMPSNNLPLAIISTILGCCSPCWIGLILGIIAIVYSSQVRTKYNAQDYDGAQKAAKNVKIFSFISLGLVVINIIIQLVIYSIYGIAYYENYFNQFK
ncbi:CD225/dispanin family protein [Apibacter adventoris]|uniref:CD225/dispanin family protein n=1 Tax=Apibacter adventoris TaxID=1679466 RepID=UPI000CF60981|nr:CD225/dispanin family protein [Apibacter adventoris]PQL94695.1 hypothetical protein C4S76_04490 [Apibacter adventoris]